MADKPQSPGSNAALLRAEAKIRADADDRKTRRYLSFLLIGALLVLALGIIVLAVVLGTTDKPIPAWLSSQIPIVVQAIILGATTAWAYNLGSSAGSRSKDEKPAEQKND